MAKAQPGQIIAGAALKGAASWLQGGRRNALLALLCVGVLAFAALEAWKQYGATHAHFETYTVGVQGIEITPPPPWVRTSLKADVVRFGSLERLSLLEKDSTRRVSDAFALHPWVHHVQRVAKHYPASMSVELTYRKPVAVVEVEHGSKPGLLPVDREGVLLPPEDFTVGQVKALPRISVGKTFPAGAVGTAWGDDRVAAAALVAEGLCDNWPQETLFQIAALPAGSGGKQSTSFEIVARDGRRFPWGHAPGSEVTGEKIAADKRADLFKWAGTKEGS